MSESFFAPQSAIIGSYAYRQYANDPNLQAFFSILNTLQQSILDWFENTPLAVYTSDAINGPLLDWTATGIYGIARPILSTLTSASSGLLGTNVLGTHTFGVFSQVNSGTTVTVTDDIYKRVLTWTLFRGDGLNFTMPWLLRRVERFLGGVNGVDVPIDLVTRPTISVSGAAFSITVPAASANPASPIFQQLMGQGFLPTPLPYTFTVTVG